MDTLRGAPCFLWPREAQAAGMRIRLKAKVSRWNVSMSAIRAPGPCRDNGNECETRI